MNQSVAESGFGPSIFKSCAWAVGLKEEDQIWASSPAIRASMLEAELWVIEHKKKASAGGEIGSQRGSCVGYGV